MSTTHQTRYFSRDGMLTISLLLLAPALYCLSVPFVYKALLASGIEMERSMEILNTVYKPIELLFAADVPFEEPLKNYYMAIYRWLGLL